MTLDNNLKFKKYVTLNIYVSLGEGCEIVCVHVDVCFIGLCLVCDFVCNREDDGKIKDITELNINGDFCLRYYIYT